MGDRPHSRVYREAFIEAHGRGPYTCWFCSQLMNELEVVHHLDEDVTNQNLDNLAAAHTDCHNKAHHVGLQHTDEVKQQIGKSLRRAYTTGARARPNVSGHKNPFYGRTHSPEARAKISAAAQTRNRGSFTGRKHTAEARAKISAARRARSS